MSDSPEATDQPVTRAKPRDSGDILWEDSGAKGDLSGVCTSPGGTIRTYLRLEGPAQNRIRAALITGDFFVTPPRLIFDLESRMRGVSLEDIAGEIKAFFKQSDFEVLSVSPDDFIASIEDALASP